MRYDFASLTRFLKAYVIFPTETVWWLLLAVSLYCILESMFNSKHSIEIYDNVNKYRKSLVRLLHPINSEPYFHLRKPCFSLYQQHIFV